MRRLLGISVTNSTVKPQLERQRIWRCYTWSEESTVESCNDRSEVTSDCDCSIFCLLNVTSRHSSVSVMSPEVTWRRRSSSVEGVTSPLTASNIVSNHVSNTRRWCLAFSVDRHCRVLLNVAQSPQQITWLTRAAVTYWTYSKTSSDGRIDPYQRSQWYEKLVTWRLVLNVSRMTAKGHMVRF